LTIANAIPAFSTYKVKHYDGVYETRDIVDSETAGDITLVEGNNITLNSNALNREVTIGYRNDVRPATGDIVVDFSTDDIITTTSVGNITISFMNYKIGTTVKVIIKPSIALTVNLGIPGTQTTIGTGTVSLNPPSIAIIEYTCTTTGISGVFARI
jgi:hypothetical protein